MPAVKGQKYKTKPTLKQRRALDKIIENHGNISKAMREVGYDETTAKNPKNLTESKGWKELLKTHLKDEKLMKVLNEGLEATKPFSSHTEPDKEVPDYAVRHKYMDTGFKLKNRFPKEGNTNLIQVNIGSDREEFK